MQAGGAGGLGRRGRGGGRGITCRKEKKGHVAGGAGEEGFHRPWAPATVQESQQQRSARLPEQGEGETQASTVAESKQRAPQGAPGGGRAAGEAWADRAATRREATLAEKSPLSARADGVRNLRYVSQAEEGLRREAGTGRDGAKGLRGGP